MKICSKCHAQNYDNAFNCQMCGASLIPASQTAPRQTVPPQQGYQQQTAPPQQGYQQYSSYQVSYKPNENRELTSLKNDISTAQVLGIVSILGVFFLRLATIICGLIGMSKAKSAIKEAENYDDPLLRKKAKDALLMNKVPFLVVVILLVLATVGTLVMFLLGIGLFSDEMSILSDLCMHAVFG